MTSKNVVLVHGGFVDGSGWGSGLPSAAERRPYGDRRPESNHFPQRRRPRDEAGHRSAGRPRTAGQGIHMEGRDYGSWKRSQGCRTGLYRCVCSRRRGIGVQPDQEIRRRARRCLRFCRHRTAYLFLDKAKFRASFAADVDAGKAEFMAASQVPWGVEALDGRNHPTSLEDQARLVLGRHRRPDDSTARAAFHV